MKTINQRGFTIVELLIVIVVIGILAAIVIVAYNGIQTQANEASVKSDLSTIAKKIELFKVRSNLGRYPATMSELDSMDIRVTQGSYEVDRYNYYYCRSPDYQHYSIGVAAVGGSTYYLTDGVVKQVSAVSSSDNCLQFDPDDILANHPVTAGYSWDATTETGFWNDWVK